MLGATRKHGTNELSNNPRVCPRPGPREGGGHFTHLFCDVTETTCFSDAARRCLLLLLLSGHCVSSPASETSHRSHGPDGEGNPPAQRGRTRPAAELGVTAARRSVGDEEPGGAWRSLEEPGGAWRSGVGSPVSPRQSPTGLTDQVAPRLPQRGGAAEG
ncbi:hypothetical protein F2P81_015808 [Scophthalmus maximus]|uniref:Uncharacterized protein n=1 Tax=Scophthalmus maximus TaxID=52904 RepID=A0A6A4SAJ1_SCOMX|nr:hypothetical protein F2P81_015808 [Scophthalmus maximus]